MPNHRPTLRTLAGAARAGRLDRREFLTLASILGASAGAAYGLLGLAAPGQARADTPLRGGVLRIAQPVLEINDPRLYDWPEKGNVARQFLEPLVRLEADGRLTGRLLDGWEVSEDALTYTLRVRRGVTWTNGDAFTADDVIHNIRRFADSSVAGNSMAARLSALRDGGAAAAPETIEKLDSHSLRLHLKAPDISLIASFSDYPALCVHPSFPEGGNLAEAPIGTGPFELVSFGIGTRAVFKRRESGAWWGGEALLDGIEFIDFGTDEGTVLAALAGGEADMNDQTSPEFDEAYEAAGLIREAAMTTNTMVARMNMLAPPFTDQRVRRALQLAVDNGAVLQLAIAGQGAVAENHHVGPLHPEYAALPPVAPDPARARALLAEAGHAETEFELISIDDGWLRSTADVIAGQLRAAGIGIRRTVLPGATFWNGWTKFPFSTTSWGARPLGVSNYALAYRSGEAWNETGFSDPEFDTKLAAALSIFDADARRGLMAEMEQILQDSGVLIQPYWNALIMHHVEGVRDYQRHPNREMHLEAVWLEP